MIFRTDISSADIPYEEYLLLREQYRRERHLPPDLPFPKNDCDYTDSVAYRLDSPPINDVEAIRSFTNYLYQYYPQAKIILQCVADCSNYDTFEAADWFSRQSFGELILPRRYDIPNAVTCPQCGNPTFDCNFFYSRSNWKAPRKAIFNVGDEFLPICTSEFIEKYEQQKFTGLTFIPIDDVYYRVSVAEHQWQERSGVCTHCNMKTNVIPCAFFNLKEEYLYDFQFIRVNTHSYRAVLPSFIFSRRAYKFLIENYHKPELKPNSSLPWTYITQPVIPGYMSDLVYPKPRMYYNGSYPMDIYVNSPDDSAAPEGYAFKED